MSFIRIAEANNFCVDYDKTRGIYRVSVFEKGHFKEEYRFDAYEDKEVDVKIEKIANKLALIKDRLAHWFSERFFYEDAEAIERFFDKFITWIYQL